MPDPQGFLRYERALPARRPVPVRIKDWREVYPSADEPLIREQATRCMDCGVPFCHSGCPLGNRIPDWNDLVRTGQWAQAIEQLHATNNFPEFTGRLCPAPCEAACVLAIDGGEAVTIKQIEVEIVNRAFDAGLVTPQSAPERSGKRVAVVGSGPAGLAAAQQLARAGHAVTVYERDDELGDLTRSLEAMTDSLSERMDAIESFAADVAHEIKNPLTSLRSAIETLDLVTDPAARERLLGILKNDVKRLDRLVTDISNASRLDAELSRDQPKAIDLERLINDITALYQATAKPGDVTVRFYPPEGLDKVTVSGREGPLGQVMRNLIDNARSFSPPAGQVSVALQRAMGRVIATVADSGPGIPPENLETVFERFYTSRPKGTAFGANSGLGLSIVRQIVDAHGGRVHAENRTGENGAVVGARFEVLLPLAGRRP